MPIRTIKNRALCLIMSIPICFIILIGSAVLPSRVTAAMVNFDLNDLEMGRYEYTYEVFNDLPDALFEFTVYVEPGRYDNLSVTGTPDGWDALVVDPSPALPDDGFFDALALNDGNAIQPGNSLGGFSVAFDYLGQDQPGPQRFEIVDPGTYAVLDYGMTEPSAVPLPASLLLLISGVMLPVVRRAAAFLS